MHSLPDILDRHQLVLIDAFGVLVTSRGQMPGAKEFLDEIRRRNLDYYIVTNDASRLPETAQAFYRPWGLDVPLDRILTSGLAIAESFKRYGMNEPRCVVLGKDDTSHYVERAGGRIVELTDSAEYEALIVAAGTGYEFIPSLDAALTSLYRQLKAGRPPKMLLANSDMLYPKGDESFGFTSGSTAYLLEGGLRQLMPGGAPEFELLGKPAPLLFEMALERAGRSASEAVMFGDQLHTDIKGANQLGIASALVAGGLTKLPLPSNLPADQSPTYVISGNFFLDRST